MGFLYSQLIYKPPYPTQSFAGRTVIVTGSNIGMGKEGARHFARLQADKVILAVRNLPAGEEAKADIERTTKTIGVVEVWELDLASYASVKAFAKRADRELKRLDIAVLNASVATGKYAAPEGLESHMTVNVVSTIMLLILLLPLMRSTAAKLGPSEDSPHIALIGSGIHHWLDLPLTKYPEGQILTNLSRRDIFPNMQGGTPVPANYIYSKLLQAFLVRELATKINPDEVILNYNCPGLVQSGLRREWGRTLTAFIMNRLARTAEVGGRTLVAGAVADKSSHGQGLSDAKIQKTSGPNNAGYSPFVWSEDGKVMQERVWNEVKAILEKEGVDLDKSFGRA